MIDLTELVGLGHHLTEHGADFKAEGAETASFIRREVAAIESDGEPVLGLLLLAIGIGELAHKMSGVAALGPCLGELATD